MKTAPQEKTAPLILLVDDVPENLQLLGNTLQEENYEIAVASSGADALNFVNEVQPDLILLDVMMPEMDGYEMCRRLKKMPQCSTIPIIFITARVETEDIVRGFEAGGVDYVTKPFKPAELKARVRTHLQLHQLKSLLPICMFCNKIHDENDRWERIDLYIYKRTGTNFSHGMCPECAKKYTSNMPL